MRSAVIALSISLLFSVVVSSYHSSAKLRRDGVLNLYPFPRVGRASPRSWQVPLSKISDLYLDYEPVEKRQLYAFPRVGRGHDEIFGRRDMTGLWYGPRVGREYKRVEQELPVQNEAERSEPEQIEPETERMKRQAKNTD